MAQIAFGNRCIDTKKKKEGQTFNGSLQQIAVHRKPLRWDCRLHSVRAKTKTSRRISAGAPVASIYDGVAMAETL